MNIIKEWLPMFRQLTPQELEQISKEYGLGLANPKAQDIIEGLFHKEKFTRNPTQDLEQAKAIATLVGRSYLLRSVPAYVFHPKEKDE